MELVHPGQHDSTGDTDVFQDWLKQEDGNRSQLKDCWMSIHQSSYSVLECYQLKRVGGFLNPISRSILHWIYRKIIPLFRLSLPDKPMLSVMCYLLSVMNYFHCGFILSVDRMLWGMVDLCYGESCDVDGAHCAPGHHHLSKLFYHLLFVKGRFCRFWTKVFRFTGWPEIRWWLGKPRSLGSRCHFVFSGSRCHVDFCGARCHFPPFVDLDFGG